MTKATAALRPFVEAFTERQEQSKEDKRIWPRRMVYLVYPAGFMLGGKLSRKLPGQTEQRRVRHCSIHLAWFVWRVCNCCTVHERRPGSSLSIFLASTASYLQFVQQFALSTPLYSSRQRGHS